MSEPRQPETLALSLACRTMEDEGTCTRSSSLFGRGYLSISRRWFPGPETLYDYVVSTLVLGLVTSQTMSCKNPAVIAAWNTGPRICINSAWCNLHEK